MEAQNLKEIRNNLGITLQEAATSTGVPLRTYIRYEADNSYGNFLKRKAIIEAITLKYEISEDKGILSIENIINVINEVFEKYNDQIQFCYLFGSYAKGYAKENSDVDLCISTNLEGLNFVGLIEELREKLKKKVDLLRLSDMKDNIELINDIMLDGIKVYGGKIVELYK